MHFSKLFIKRPVTTIMVVFVIILVGMVSLMGIPMDLMPNIELPVAIVYTQYGAAAPEEIENMVTVPVEQALSSVENLEGITSMTMSGASIVMVEFAMETDMNFATLDMREKIDMIKGFLPEDAGEPMVMKMSMDFAPTAQVYISGDMGLAELNEEIENNILPRLERAGGVASASVYGGVSEEITLNFDQEKLSGYGLTLAAVNQILAAENLNMPSGEITKGDTKVVVRTMGQFNSVDEIREIPMAMADGSIVRLQELANIEMGYTEQEAISRVDGASAIGISLSKQSSANTVEVSDKILAELEDLREDYPDLNFVMGFDQADYIRSSITSVAQSALTGAILAIVVLFLFLRNLSATLVIAISIPTSILATFALMNLMDMTLNLITLCALTLAVGMLVDNSVVVLENIVRVSKQDKLNAMEASSVGSKQVVLAVMASTLTSVVVYLPIALSDGIASMLFRDFCWTIIIALVASLLVSLSVVPMLTSKMLNTGASDQYLRIGKKRYRYKFVNKFGTFIEFLKEGYGRALTSMLKKRKRVIAVCLIIFIVSVSLLGVVGMEFLPASDEGSFTVSMDTPYGTSLKTKEALLSEVEAYVLALPEVEHCTLDIGQTSALLGGNSSSLSVTLVPRQDRVRSTAEVADEVRDAFSSIAGADLTVSEAASMTAMLGGADISLTVKG
ncbi:MAG: efflux RND transporter permease subunit, partial [Clostridiales bacterium]|nr:efflux RND transporter permease subunit [Clostridiales bacterium]